MSFGILDLIDADCHDRSQLAVLEVPTAPHAPTDWQTLSPGGAKCDGGLLPGQLPRPVRQGTACRPWSAGACPIRPGNRFDPHPRKPGNQPAAYDIATRHASPQRHELESAQRQMIIGRRRLMASEHTGLDPRRGRTVISMVWAGAQAAPSHKRSRESAGSGSAGNPAAWQQNPIEVAGKRSPRQAVADHLQAITWTSISGHAVERMKHATFQPGQQIVHCFVPFLRHLLSLPLSPAGNPRQHRDNIWVLGGEIVRRLQMDSSLRRRPIGQDHT